MVTKHHKKFHHHHIKAAQAAAKPGTVVDNASPELKAALKAEAASEAKFKGQTHMGSSVAAVTDAVDKVKAAAAKQRPTFDQAFANLDQPAPGATTAPATKSTVVVNNKTKPGKPINLLPPGMA